MPYVIEATVEFQWLRHVMFDESESRLAP
jgi:hypothetical protein